MDKKNWAVEVHIDGVTVVGLYSDGNAQVLANPRALEKAARIAEEFASYVGKVRSFSKEWPRKKMLQGAPHLN